MLLIFFSILFAAIFNSVSQESNAEEKGTIRILSAKLPTERDHTAAIWDGENAYVLCRNNLDDEGHQNSINEVIRFNPITNEVTIMDVFLPMRGGGISAIWDGNDIYIFGGESRDEEYGWGAYDEIVRYNPDSITAEKVPFLLLPSERSSTSAIFDGKSVYIFGGFIQGSKNEIVRYNISKDEIEIMPSILPDYTAEASAIWDGENAYIFGGGEEPYKGHIIRYNPLMDSVKIMNATFPQGKRRISAIWDGNYAYIFGGVYFGIEGWTRSDEIVRYDPKSDNVTIMPTRLPVGIDGTSAVWTGEKAYIFGGAEGRDNLSNQILE